MRGCGGEILLRKFVEQALRLGTMGSRARQARRGLRPAFGQGWKNLMAQVVTRKIGLGVRRVFDPAQAVRARVGLQLGARNIKQGTAQMALPQRPLTWHGRHPVHPCPAQQAKQHGFCLIITVLARQQNFARLRDGFKSLIARVTRGTLKACAWANLHVKHLQRHSQRITQRLTMRRPRISRSLQAMMHMDRGQSRKRVDLTQMGEQVQQNS